MQPIATTKGKLTQLRYELPQRVHEAVIYPVKAPNGSTILLYAHETGVSLVWRGGRPLKKAAPPSKQAPKPQQANGANNDAIMIIDSDDDEPAKTPAAPSMAQAEFEDEEEELDSEHPYPSIVQQIRLSFNTEVLHIAVPQVPTSSALRPADTIPAIFKNKLIFTATCADSTIRIVTLPLSPPPDSVKEKPVSASSHYGEEVVKFHGHQSIARGVTMTWTSRAEPSGRQETDDEMDVDVAGDAGATPGRRRRAQHSRSRSQPATAAGFDILVATHSAEVGGLFKIWRFELTETSVNGAQPIVPYKTITLRKPASSIAFNSAQFPKRRHSHLLITDLTGTARVYDPFTPASRKRNSSGQIEPGAFIATFKSTFEGIRSASLTPPILATRKAILDAAWASDGRHILALLADGEWGVWDCDQSGPSPSADPASFSLRGFVGTGDKDAGNNGPSSPKRGSRSSLAPMTPNTRRRKEDNLFHGNSSGIAVPVRGGVSVASTISSNGTVSEDSVIMWYGAEVYRVADLAKFWTRNTSASRGQSLPGPGLTQIHDIPLLGESITSIVQFETTAAASRMAIGRDILIAAEHRLIISASTNQPQERDLFAPTPAEEEASRRADQALLTRGELDIGGMDRLLDDMESSGSGLKSLTMGNQRKVLFASSAA
ncbi:Nucleoporin NUP37 [Stagonosporopsis vannaccii]|nr:Nucleoporin NUP37 [Stagonosporopsis vannaccii]